MKNVLIKTVLISGLICFTSQVFAQDSSKTNFFPWKDPNNPNVILLDANDPLKDGWSARRDTSKDPKREPGLYNPQRYSAGLTHMGGFPSFLGAPLAANAADLKAGGVEIAMVGLNIDDNLIAGGRYAANQLRTLTDYMFFGTTNYDPQLHVEYLESMQLADYGNIASVYGHNQRSLEEIHKVIGEILSADAMPLAIGGSHIQMYGIITALTEKYGAGNFALVHLDAHYDAMSSGMGGRFVHNGSMVYRAVEILEYNPLLDDAHQTTGILVDRLMRAVIAGIAARKQGITDPLHVAPAGLDHGQK